MLHHCIICFAVFIAASHIILYIIPSSTPYTFTSVIASHFPNITPSSMADTSRLPRDTIRRLPPNPCTRAADVSSARPFMPAFTILIPRHDALAITQSSAFPTLRSVAVWFRGTKRRSGLSRSLLLILAYDPTH